MVKYYLKNGDEVAPGDYVDVMLHVNTPFGKVDTPFGKKGAFIKVLLDEKSIEILKEMNYITVKEDLYVNTLPFITEFAQSKNISKETATHIIESLIEDEDYLIAVYILLKSASLFDSVDIPISNKKKVAVFNFYTGGVEELTKPRPCDIVFDDVATATRAVNRLSRLIKVAYGR